MKFKLPMSGAFLSSDDLNDFIKPSVACVVKPKPAKSNSKRDKRIEEESDEVIEVSINGSNNNANGNLEAAQISLTDCLACSGCITSAEEILVAQQSHKELISVLRKAESSGNNDFHFVASVSPQLRASLANVYNMSINDVDLMLIDLFVNQLKFKYIVGTQFGRMISLKETIKEIREHEGKKVQGPLMSSICPGFVLYVEKTHPEVLDNLSKVRSPQLMTGSILKLTASKELQVPIEKIFHVAVMPCFDKKLEAARYDTDDINEEKNIMKEVDIVITAKELVLLSIELNLDLKPDFVQSNAKEKDAESHDELATRFSPHQFQFGKESWYSNFGTASGGYADFYIEYLRSVKYKNESTTTKIIEGRNKDIWEHRVFLEGDNGKKTLVGRVAIVNGFRNIQNLIRKFNEIKGTKVTRKKKVIRRRNEGELETKGSNKENDEAIDLMKCNYIEVMACPGGCINGGGQISNGSDTKLKDSDWTKLVEEKYHDEIPMVSNMSDPKFQIKLEQYLTEFSKSFRIDEKKLLFTKFHDVKLNTIVDEFENSAIALTSKW